MLFTFPSRYWFTIGCQGVFSLIRWSGRIRTAFHVHRATWDTHGHSNRVVHPAVTVSGCPFHGIVLRSVCPLLSPATLDEQVHPVWAVPLSLAATDGITSFSFPRVTEMFHFTPFRFPGLCIHPGMPVCKPAGYPIRKSPDQRLLAAPRSLSQLAASFVASWHPGIHHLPFVA